ncbi:MAG: macro domain-containing protein [Anaerolineales bacterium]
MKHQFPSGQVLTLIHGDLTTQKVDAIVNAANPRLRHGGGVAAIILRRGGPEINRESRAWLRDHGPVTHEEPAYTTGGNLPCQFVIHAVGPVWGGQGDEEEKLENAIAGALKRAEELELSSIAFSAISTGIFGFPHKQAAQVFFQVFQRYFEEFPGSALKDVRMVVYDENTTEAFNEVWAEMEANA